MKKSEKSVLEAAKTLGTFTPTELGVMLGYETAQASSRVAPALRSLVEAGKLVKTKISHNRATYRLA